MGPCPTNPNGRNGWTETPHPSRPPAVTPSPQGEGSSRPTKGLPPCGGAKGRAHIVRAALESIAYQSADVLEAMSRDSSTRLNVLHVDGGASANNFLMQYLSDILGVNVERPATLEVTALGAAFLAGLAVGYWSGLDDVRNRLHIERVFEPSADKEKQVQRYKGWKKAVSRALQWIDVED